MESTSYDEFILTAAGMIGQELDGFLIGKRNKTQTILTPIGELGYFPEKQYRGGVICLTGRDESLIVELDCKTQKVERVAMDIGEEQTGLLGPKKIELAVGKGSTIESLTGNIATLARKVLELERTCNELKNRK